MNSPKGEKKTGFAAISNQDAEILILGTFPGAMSLESNEYYANPRNRFWRIIAEINNERLPENYAGKQELLVKHKIGLWDVAGRAVRKGSLDANISEIVPNDLNGFIPGHKNLKIVAFNGKKAERLFNRHFIKQNHIKYVLLLSTSPANTAYGYNEIRDNWSEKLII